MGTHMTEVPTSGNLFPPPELTADQWWEGMHKDGTPFWAVNRDVGNDHTAHAYVAQVGPYAWAVSVFISQGEDFRHEVFDDLDEAAVWADEVLGIDRTPPF